MTTTVNVGVQPSNWLKWEASIEFCREQRVLPAGTAVSSGTVVMEGAAADQVVEWDLTGAVVGVIYLDRAAPAAADGECVIVARGPCIVGKSGLRWADAATPAQIADGEAKLAALGFVVRADL